MPATTSRIYLNTGTFGPLPSCVIEAMQDRMQREWCDGRLDVEVSEAIKTVYGQARSSVARLLSADVQEIALTDNTGEGMNTISYGFNWHAVDEIITTDHEHMGALAPLYQIRDRYGVVIRVAQLGQMAERPAHEAIRELVTERTRLIVLSHVTWTTGAVLDIHAVGGMAHEHGIPVLVDGAQSAGAIPVDVTALDIDFYAIPIQKWLCGPDGTGALYVKRESQHYVSSTYVGYWSHKHRADGEWELEDSAQRFELGGRQTAALAGQCAALDWLEQTVGYPWLFKRISSLHAYAYHALQAVPGLTLLTPAAGISGIVAFSLAGRDSEDVIEQLREKHNIAIRAIPLNNALRISTGFYNTEEEIDILVEALAKL
jgi:L-cysteine/cystine lyase